MRIAVLGGGGAMGGLFGAYLARAGEDVVLIDVSKPAVDEINKNGVTIEEKDGSSTTIKVAASLKPESVGPVDLILNFVKCYHTDAAVRAAMPMATPETAFLSLQNGWGNAGRIAAIAGDARVMVGLTYHSATLLAPGRVKHPGVGVTYVGELNGEESPRLKAAAAALRSAGFEVSSLSADTRRDLEKAGAERLHAADRGAAALLRQRVESARGHDRIDEGPPRRSGRRWQGRRALRSTRVSAGRRLPDCSIAPSARRHRCFRTSKRTGRRKST